MKSVGATAAGLDTEPHVSVYMALDAAPEDVRRVEDALRAQPDAATVKFVSRAQALAELQSTTHLADVLASLERNPLPDAFTVRMRTTDADRIAVAKAAWSRLPKVDQVAADFEWSERLARWARFGERVVLAIGLLLAGAVAFIVAHLIRLQVLTRQDEIEVSQLVGATAADVRRPFLYHGALEGLFAGAAALGLAALVAAWIGTELSALTPSYAAELKVIFLSPAERAILVGGAAALGLAGAWTAVARELRRFAGDR
jgi:cell division transport system permease protein